MKILLLEDDQLLSTTLQLFLERNGYSVDIALTMQEAEELSFMQCYALYLFDINLPEGSGLELLKGLRHAEDNTPTIFITALTDLHSIAEGFELGAMDYIKKPFNPEELLIRIKSKFKETIICYNDIEYDEASDLLRKNGVIMDIGNVQHKIFIKLLLGCGTMIHKDELYECLERVSNTALRVAISKIKQRLGVDIKNIRGKGYLIEKT